jgi:serine/threonine protein kinase
MNADRLCMGCMEDRGDSSTCARCGWQEGQRLDSPLYLPPRTVLHEQYVVGRVLGHGGFGITYLGWDLNLARRIAIKEYLPGGVAARASGDPRVTAFTGSAKQDFEYGLEKFLEEARTVAKFQNHPGIVAVTNFFRENGTAYLVMEYLNGITLDAYLGRQGGKVAPDAAVRIMMPVMDALREVHAAGVLHRDISPDNVYLCENGQVKLLDFGAARYAFSQHSRNLSVILKEGYAPEEQYRSKGIQGPWTDVYAVAATLYRSIAGTVPQPALDRMDTDDLAPPSTLGIEIAPVAEAALAKALAIRAADRFQSIEDFQSALRGKLPAAAVAAASASIGGPTKVIPQPRPVAPPPAPPVPAKASSSRARSAGIAAASAAVVLGIAFAAKTLVGPAPQPAPVPATAPSPSPVQDTVVPPPPAPSGATGTTGPTVSTGPVSNVTPQPVAMPKPPTGKPTAMPSTDPPARITPPVQTQTGATASTGTTQTASQGGSYADLVNQARAALNRHNSAQALAVATQAVRLDASKPDAYSVLAFANLYYNHDMAAAASAARDAVQHGGTARFRVKHDHLEGRFLQTCSGDLLVGRSGVQYVADNAVHSFQAARTEIKEAKLNKGVLGFITGFGKRRRDDDESGASSNAFHVKTAADNYNLIGTSPNRREEADLILGLINKRK